MNLEEARDILIAHNKWRRDDHIPNQYEMPNPIKLGIALEVAISSIDRLIELREGYRVIKENMEVLTKINYN